MLQRVFGLVIIPIVFGYAVGACVGLSGCASILPELGMTDKELDDLNDRLSKCRAEARAYVQTSADPTSKETAATAYMKYDECKRREHIEGEGAR